MEVLQAQIDELRIDLDRGRALRRQWVGVAGILVVALVVTAAVKVKGTDLEIRQSTATVGDDSPALKLVGHTNSTADKAIQLLNVTESGLDSYRLAIQDNSSNERMSVLDGGNVGIGSASPGQRLTVAGTVESTSGGFRFPDGTTQTSASSGSSSVSSLDAEEPGRSREEVVAVGGLSGPGGRGGFSSVGRRGLSAGGGHRVSSPRQARREGGVEPADREWGGGSSSDGPRPVHSRISRSRPGLSRSPPSS